MAGIRTFALCLALFTIAGVEFWASESLANRVGQFSCSQTDSPQAPSVSLSDLMAAAR